MSEPYYDGDLTDEERHQIALYSLPTNLLAKEREVNLRDVLNAIFYRADNGFKWWALPKDFPAWQTVYGYFRLWVRSGAWEQINLTLVRAVRTSVGRQAEPSLAILASLPAKLGQKGGQNTALSFLIL